MSWLRCNKRMLSNQTEPCPAFLPDLINTGLWALTVYYEFQVKYCCVPNPAESPCACFSKAVQKRNYKSCILSFAAVLNVFISSCTVTKWGCSYYPQWVVRWRFRYRNTSCISPLEDCFPSCILYWKHDQKEDVCGFFVYCFNNWSENFLFDYLACANIYIFLS